LKGKKVSPVATAYFAFIQNQRKNIDRLCRIKDKNSKPVRLKLKREVQ
jgi:hypothetical protein